MLGRIHVIDEASCHGCFPFIGFDQKGQACGTFHALLPGLKLLCTNICICINELSIKCGGK
jgi:hypothetical protein